MVAVRDLVSIIPFPAQLAFRCCVAFICNCPLVFQLAPRDTVIWQCKWTCRRTLDGSTYFTIADDVERSLSFSGTVAGIRAVELASC